MIWTRRVGVASATCPWLRTAWYCDALLREYIICGLAQVLVVPLLRLLLLEELLELEFGSNAAVR